MGQTARVQLVRHTKDSENAIMMPKTCNIQCFNVGRPCDPRQTLDGPFSLHWDNRHFEAIENSRTDPLEIMSWQGLVVDGGSDDGDGPMQIRQHP